MCSLSILYRSKFIHAYPRYNLLQWKLSQRTFKSYRFLGTHSKSYGIDFMRFDCICNKQIRSMFSKHCNERISYSYSSTHPKQTIKITTMNSREQNCWLILCSERIVALWIQITSKMWTRSPQKYSNLSWMHTELLLTFSAAFFVRIFYISISAHIIIIINHHLNQN